MSTLGFVTKKGRDDGLKLLIIKCALKNATEHGGKASIGAVMGKVISARPDIRNNPSRVRQEIEEIVRSVNFVSIEEQKRRLKKLEPKGPEMEKDKKNKKTGLPDLPNVIEGKIVTRFAPCPSGPLNIFQVLRALMLSYLYAKKYKGKFILRFEDTDPAEGKISKEFYDMIREDMKFLGAKYSEEVTESMEMDLFYAAAKKIILSGHAYVDFTPADEFRSLKLKKIDPETRNASPENNLKAWNDMLKGKYKDGEAVLRFKTSMQNKNPAVRDPAIFRIASGNHPLVGEKYRVWPLYNFANVIEDHECNVTHVFRGKEHEHNTWIQEKIYDSLDLEPPTVINFGMIYLPGKKEHTRDIKEKIKKGQYSGWDDPRLHTIFALRKRGFVGKAFQEVAVVAGLSKSDIRFSWDSLEAANRKNVDSYADRYMAVFDPVKISIKGYPHETNFVTMPRHPDSPRRGIKKLPVDETELYIQKDDFKRFNKKTVRLKGFININLSSKIATYEGEDVKPTMRKIHWVSSPHIKVILKKPEGDKITEIVGFGEPSMESIKPGHIIQLERVGFCVVESVKKGQINLIWSHK